MTKPVKKRSKMTIARRVVVAAAFVACVVGVLAFGGAGSYCSFGVDAIAAICPLGSLEALFGYLYLTGQLERMKTLMYQAENRE